MEGRMFYYCTCYWLNNEVMKIDRTLLINGVFRIFLFCKISKIRPVHDQTCGVRVVEPATPYKA